MSITGNFLQCHEDKEERIEETGADKFRCRLHSLLSSRRRRRCGRSGSNTESSSRTCRELQSSPSHNMLSTPEWNPPFPGCPELRQASKLIVSTHCRSNMCHRAAPPHLGPSSLRRTMTPRTRTPILIREISSPSRIQFDHRGGQTLVADVLLGTSTQDFNIM